MKKKLAVIIAMVLAAGTLGLQLPKSIAQEGEAASAFVDTGIFHGSSQSIGRRLARRMAARFPKTIRPIVSAPTPREQPTMLAMVAPPSVTTINPPPYITPSPVIVAAPAPQSSASGVGSSSSTTASAASSAASSVVTTISSSSTASSSSKASSASSVSSSASSVATSSSSSSIQTTGPGPDPLAAIVQPDITAHHQALTRKILGLLPAECQRKLTDFHVIYDNPGHRGLAGRGTIVMNGSIDDKAFVAMLLHEGFGHFWDLTCTDGTASAGNSPFDDFGNPVYANDPSASFYAISWTSNSEQRVGSTDLHFASRYGKGDPWEDLAENAVAFVLTRERMEGQALQSTVMAQKLAWFRTYFPVQQRLASGSVWDGQVVWDASKSPYTWLGL